jgi:hypothetical protein
LELLNSRVFFIIVGLVWRIWESMDGHVTCGIFSIISIYATYATLHLLSKAGVGAARGWGSSGWWGTHVGAWARPFTHNQDQLYVFDINPVTNDNGGHLTSAKCIFWTFIKV